MAGGDERTIVPGTTVARRGRGVLLRGMAGSGKSDLALRALTQPLQLPGEGDASVFELVSDDQTVIERHGARLIAAAPEPIHGLIEVRGAGIVRWPAISVAEIVLVADLTTGTIERMPEQNLTCSLLGLTRPRIDISPFEASAIVKIAVALQHRGNRPG